jgi:uroporphyrinogen-III decarboxylase
MNLDALEEFGKEGYDGFMFCDDWGLQDRLMISPEKWRELWMPRYAKVYAKAHEFGILTMLHSCGYIVDILDDLIDIGLDVIHMDQQENMGLDLLAKRFSGRIAFFSPVDIQTVLPRGDFDEIRAYCWKMAKAFATPKGGFIPRWYGDPKGGGHSMDAVNVMCEEFLKISKEIYG